MPTTELPRTVSKVPSILELRRKINYGEDRKAQWAALLGSLQSFRQGYKTKSGTPGSDYVDWKNPLHKSGLRFMAKSYFENEEGPRFWPDDPEAQYYNALQHSTDREHIILVLVQILFRLNKQEHLHLQQKPSKKIDGVKDSDKNPGGHPLAGLSPSEWKAQKPASAVDMYSTPKRHKAAESSSHTKDTPTVELTPSSRSNEGSDEGHSMTLATPTPGIRKRILQPSLNQGNVKPGLMGIALKTATSTVEQDQSTEQSKSQGSGKKRPREEPTFSCPGRNSPRKRKPPNRENFATWEEFRRACSPTPSDAQPDSLSTVEQPQQQSSIAKQTDTAAKSHPELKLNVDTVMVEAPMQPQKEATNISNTTNRNNPPSGQATRPPLGEEPELYSGEPSTSSRGGFENMRGWRPGMRTPDASVTVSPGLRANTDDRLDDPFNPIGNEENMPPPGVAMNGLMQSAIASEAAPMATMGLDTMKTNPISSIEASEALEEYLDQNNTSPGSGKHQSTTDHDNRDKGKEPQTPTNRAVYQARSPQDTSEPRTPSSTSQIVKYVLVHSRSPRWQAEFWTPRGKFMKTRLPDLMNELPPSFVNTVKHSPGLMFRMIGAGSREEQPIPHGDDEEFESMKQLTLRGAFAKHRKTVVEKAKHADGEGPSFRIEIEALGENFIAEAGDLSGEMEEDEIF